MQWERRLPRKRLELLIGLVLGLVLLTVLSYRPLLTVLGQFLIVREELKPADVIIVLAGEREQRVGYGVWLYQQGYAPKIIMAGGPVVWRVTAAQIMKEQAVFLGVPAQDILVEERSTTTKENAEFTKDLMVAEGFGSAILVTSPYHSRRASRIFHRVFGQEMEIISVPVPNSRSSVDDWWTRDRNTRQVVSEYLKMIWPE